MPHGFESWRRSGGGSISGLRMMIWALGKIMCSILASLPAATHAVAVAGPTERPALMSHRAPQSAMLDVTRAGDRLVAVGERGIVVLSDDSGKTWRQAKVPVSVTLNAVKFPTSKQGWAVGHYGIVLHTEDGGETWVRQLDGVAAAALAVDAAEKSAWRADPANKSADDVASARQLVRDGPDKPFFDLHFYDAHKGIVVGAYNLIYRTTDGGRTWQPLMNRMENPKALHLYTIGVAGDRVYIAGEQGLVLRSVDGGNSFVRVGTPYRGSYFALAALAPDEIVIGGLGGHAFRSSDRGKTWVKIETGATTTYSVAKALDRAFLLANQAGQLFVGGDQRGPTQLLQTPPMPPITAVALAPDGALVVASPNGVTRLPAWEPTRPNGVAGQ